MMAKHGVTIRAAVADDTPTILRLIYALAVYEGRADSCTVTESALHEALFGARPRIEALLAEQNDEAVGFALYFSYFWPSGGALATFLELLYVEEPHRGRGIGTALLRQVARIAVAQGAHRLEWGVRRRNEPAIGFYRHLGAAFSDDVMGRRLDGEALRRVADGS